MLTAPARRFLIALIIAGALLSAGLNAPFTKDQEPQSAQWIVDIVNHGHWLLPYDYYGYVERKPPLFYWLSSLAVIVTGGKVTEALARLPSLVAAAVLAAETMAWAARDFDETSGLLAFLFLLGMYGFAARATLALTDMLMTCLMLTGYRLLEPLVNGRASPRRAITAGLVLGLGVLTKGPVVLVLVAVAAAIYLLLMRTNPLGLLRQASPWIVLAVAVAAAAMWYVPAFIEGRKSDLVGVFAQENFGHFMPVAMGGTGEASRPFYYIALRLIGGTLPLCLLLSALIAALPHLESRIREAIAYQGAMFVAVLLVFSIASAKRDDYILPAIPPLAIMLAALFGGTFATESARMNFVRYLRNTIVGLIAVATTLGIAALALIIAIGRRTPPAGLNLQSADSSFAHIFFDGVASREVPFLALIAMAGIGALVCLFALWRPMGQACRGLDRASGASRSEQASSRVASKLRPRAARLRFHQDAWVGGGLAVIALAMTLTWTALLKPREAATRSLRTFADEVRGRAGAQPLYLPWQDPEFSYYYGSGVPALSHAIAHDGPPPGSPVYVVARPNQLFVLAPVIRARLTPLMRADVVGGGGPPTLYRLNPISSGGRF